MLKNQRFIFNDNGTEYDYSVELDDYLSTSAVLPIVASEDKIYIGSDLPFTSKYFIVDTANSLSSSLSIDIWYNNDWESVVDLLDGTSSGGKTLAQSGLIQWKTNKDKGWNVATDSSDVDGVSASGMYDLYWIRISCSADISDTTSLKYVGYKFSEDDELFSIYPTLNDPDLQEAFASEQTDWQNQSLSASQAIIMELQASNIAFSPAQLMNVEKFKMANIHKTAHIIYSGIGENYSAEAAKAYNRYRNSMNMKQFDVDENGDGALSKGEQKVSTIYMSR